MEGDSGIVARTYGTCVLIEKNREQHHYLFDALPGISSSGTSMNENKTRETPTIGKPDEGRREDGGGSDGEESDGGKMIIKNKHHLSEAAAAAARHRESEKDEVQLLTIRDFGRRVRVRIGMYFGQGFFSF